MNRLARVSSTVVTALGLLAGTPAFAAATLAQAARIVPGTAQGGMEAVDAEAATAGAPTIAPIGSRPRGRSYSQWAAQWWQWSLQTPAGANALTDRTGQNCTAGQQGNVWFLAGNPFSILGPGPVRRSCNVPKDTALFFPIVNNGYFAFLNDAPATRTESFCRQQVESVRTQASLSLKIDGQPVGGLRNLFERSALFTVQLPGQNILGLTTAEARRLLLRPSCDAGYYVFLYPLPIGHHVLAWKAPTGAQDITYDIYVR